ncbi:MAG: GGDEF domain-containing phosphodiesterase [Actinomycetota bacterium]
MSSVQPHPIRPGGGLRRLRRGEVEPTPTGPVVLAYAQLLETLRADVERAAAQEETLVVALIELVPPIGPDLVAGVDPASLIERVDTAGFAARLARVGPDRLLVVLPDRRRRADGEEAAARLLETLARPVEVAGLAHDLLPKAGVALLDRENDTAERLVDAAGLALAEAGEQRPLVLFHPYHRVRSARRRHRAGELRDAVVEGTIGSALQPAYRFDGGDLVAFEAFARWTTADGRSIPPAEFIPLAAELGLLHQLSRQVLASAVRAAAGWERRSPADGAATTLWLNVTPAEVGHPRFADAVATAIDVNPGVVIGLELTPLPTIDHQPTVAPVLEGLVSRGARLAVGDFGAAPTPLAALERLPIDSVKLDGALVRRAGRLHRAAEATERLLALADVLQVETVAQGVESEQQALLFRSLGCDVGQGAFFAPPAATVRQVAAEMRL